MPTESEDSFLEPILSLGQTDTNAPAPESAVLADARELSGQPELVIIDVDCSFMNLDAIDALVARLNASASVIAETITTFLASGGANKLAFRSEGGEHSQRILSATASSLGDVWFIGDLHGDLLTLETALNYIEKTSPLGWKVVFLGDLFDDTGYGLEVVLRVFELISNQPERFCLLTGNHDEALYFDETSRTFSSTVIPDDLSITLNNSSYVELGNTIISLYQNTPRALIFSDGLLAAHGGFPLSDLWDSLNSPVDLESDVCLQDFVWTRIHDRSKKKIPNRTSKGCQYGYQDFEGFCERMKDLGLPVKRMVRGHDHIENRYAVYDRYQINPILTINAMSRKLPRESGPFERIPCIARHVLGKLPEVHRLLIPPEMVRKVYARFLEKESIEMI
jgi:hypothetical protein